MLLRRPAEDEVDYTLKQPSAYVGNTLLVGEWIGTGPLSAVKDVVHVLQFNLPLQPSILQHSSTYQHSYINRFYRFHGVI